MIWYLELLNRKREYNSKLFNESTKSKLRIKKKTRIFNITEKLRLLKDSNRKGGDAI